MNIEKTQFLNWKTADKIARQFSTPCYVYNEAALEEQAKKALAFPNAFGLTVRYAMKAASNKEILKLFYSLGLQIDASSAYEVKRAMLAGIPAEHISLSSQQLPGNLKEIVESGVKYNACSFRQLEEYFTGKRKDFDLPLDPEGTPFMKRVWKRLLEIPYGKTASYREIAVSIGIPGGMRAVGLASHRNPIPVIIPCHRVIGSDGGLVGYAGGLSLKRRLLMLEAEHAAPGPENSGTPQETISGK